MRLIDYGIVDEVSVDLYCRRSCGLGLRKGLYHFASESELRVGRGKCRICLRHLIRMDATLPLEAEIPDKIARGPEGIVLANVNEDGVYRWFLFTDPRRNHHFRPH